MLRCRRTRTRERFRHWRIRGIAAESDLSSENSFKRVALIRAQKNGRSESSVAESRSIRADLRDPHSNAYGICKSDRVSFAGANWHTAKTQADWIRLKPSFYPGSVEVYGRAESSGVERERPVHQPRRRGLEINL